jgi:hypothetical protein
LHAYKEEAESLDCMLFDIFGYSRRIGKGKFDMFGYSRRKGKGKFDMFGYSRRIGKGKFIEWFQAFTESNVLLIYSRMKF